MRKVYKVNWSRLALMIDDGSIEIGYNDTQDAFNISQESFNYILDFLVNKVNSWYFYDGELIGWTDSKETIQISSGTLKLSKGYKGDLALSAEESESNRLIDSLRRVLLDLKTARRFNLGSRMSLCMAGSHYMNLEFIKSRSYDYMNDSYFRELLQNQISSQSKFYVWLDYIYVVNPNYMIHLNPHDFTKAPYLRIPPQYELSEDSSKYHKILDILIENIYK